MAKKQAVIESGMSVDDLMAMANKRWPGSMRRASDPDLVIERLSTGIMSVDWGLGGGFARNRHTELFGPPSTGKTTLTYYAIAETQRNGGTAGFIDVEDKFDADWAQQCGVDIDALVLHFQEDGNRVFDIMELWIKSGALDLIVLDSIAAILPKEEREASMEDGNGYGTYQARLMSKAMRKLTAGMKPHGPAIVYINQVREDVGGSAFFKKSVTSGGRAMGHYAAARLELVRIETVKKKKPVKDAKGAVTTKEVPVGHRVLVKVQKEQTGGAYEGDQTTFAFDYELGIIDPIEDLIYLGLQYELVKLSNGTWYVMGYEDERIKGRDAFKGWLRKNRAIAEELKDSIVNYGTETVGDE